jgi:ABC-type multidrug transport system ATPase subunit
MKTARHVAAVVERRLVIHRRSKSQIIKSSVMTIMSSLTALFLQVRSDFNDRRQDSPVTFGSFPRMERVGVIGNASVASVLSALFARDLSFAPEFFYFNSSAEFDTFCYNLSQKDQLGFAVETSAQDNLTFYYWESTASFVSFQIPRIVRTIENPKLDLVISMKKLTGHISGDFVSAAVPFFVTYGLLNICMLFIVQIIEDISSERRPFMLSCSLSLFSYWIGCFLIDFAFWIIIVFVFWSIYVWSRIPIFCEHCLSSFCLLIFSGPNFILLTYCISFIFDSPETGVDFTFSILIAPLFLFSKEGLTPNKKFNRLLYLVGNIYPVSNMFNLLERLSQHQELNVRSFLPIGIASICLVGLLAFTEWTFLLADQAIASVPFASCQDWLTAERNKRISFGVREMEQRASDKRSPFALRMEKVCRLFSSSVVAVNNVSLAIGKGQTFGLLGANGAGKTTLMRMILGLIPASHGTIETDGALSYCPQFDEHLSSELTPAENLRFYGRLFGVDDVDSRASELLAALDIPEKVVRELSGGNRRKVAVAIALLSGAPIVILDEPTSSLDPGARRQVERLIQREKSARTFVLCTHLLSEAETLCDEIAIMIRGCMYTCGSPQHLAKHFGQDWKIDVLVGDAAAGGSVDEFLKARLEGLRVLFVRHNTRIYSVPCVKASVQQVFGVLGEAKEAIPGMEYFTVSSSTLEKVFIELIKTAEI